jgi:hypothetical protein
MPGGGEQPRQAGGEGREDDAARDRQAQRDGAQPPLFGQPAAAALGIEVRRRTLYSTVTLLARLRG